DHGPWHAARPADDLRVEEIADADAGGRHRCSDGYAVEQPEQTLPGSSREKPDGDGNARSAPMTCEPTPPDGQDLQRVLEVVAGLVQQTMAESRADDRADDHVT